MISNEVKSGQLLFHVYEWLKIIITFVAAVWILIVFNKDVELRKIDRTLDLANIYFTGEIMAAHQHMKATLMKEEALLRDVLQEKDSIENLGNRMEAVALRVAKDNPQHIYALSEFYFEIATCVEAKRCDPKTTCGLFGDRIDNFVFFHGGQILEWEKSFFIEPRLGVMEKLLQSPICEDIISGGKLG